IDAIAGGAARIVALQDEVVALPDDVAPSGELCPEPLPINGAECVVMAPSANGVVVRSWFLHGASPSYASVSAVRPRSGTGRSGPPPRRRSRRPRRPHR